MSYTKPGVEISQVQKSTTPILNTPELTACIIGPGYWIQDITWERADDPLHNSVYSQTYTGGSVMTIPLSGINPVYYDISAVDAGGNMVIVDLLGKTGDYTGRTRHLVKNTDFTVNSTQSTVTISGYGSATDTYSVKIGFRAARTSLDYSYFQVNSPTEIEDKIGKITVDNPLAFGANLAMLNSNTSVFVMHDTTSLGTDVLTRLKTKDPYVLAPVVTASSGAITALKSHCETMALAINKKERIAFVNELNSTLDTARADIAYPEQDDISFGAADLDVISGEIRDTNSTYSSKRIFSTFPSYGWVLEKRHVSTIRGTYLAAAALSVTVTTLNGTKCPVPLFGTSFTLNGKKYKKGDNIDATTYTTLMADGWGDSSGGMVDVYVPVFGGYFNAALAGQVIGTAPSQPLTNSSIAGIDKLGGSTDIFSEAQLNTMASGGTWILTQDVKFGPITNRHQMSTDITSVAKRELSITKALDYTSKFLRDSLKPYIGKRNITDDFLKLVNAILSGAGKYLTDNEILRDIKVVSVVQDALNPDTITVEIDVLPLYPVNYIKITLVF